MRIGIFADAHDHIDNVRRAIAQFNRNGCQLAVFAGDFVSPLIVPALRKLSCPLIACFGDNDGNRTGILSGMRILGGVAEPPVGFQVLDGTRIVVTHVLNDVRDDLGECDVVVFAHTHRPSVATDSHGRLFINPGETSGWTFRTPSVCLLETETREATIIRLPEMPPVAVDG